MTRFAFNAGTRLALLTGCIIAVLALSLDSTPAMANCQPSPTAGIILDCTGDSEIDAAVSNTGATQTANSVVQLLGAQGSLEITSTGSLTGSVANPTSAANNQNGRDIFGVNLNVSGSSWDITNNGSVAVSNVGTGQAIAMRLNNAEEVTLSNFGSITATRSASSWTVNTNTPTSLQATAAFGPTNVEVVAGVLAGENVESFVLNNGAGHSIEAFGPLAAGVFLRNGGSSVINNFGTISYSATSAGGGGVAISSSQDDEWEEETPGIASITFGVTTINNEGNINGDIQVVDAEEGTAIRYYASRLSGGYDPNGATPIVGGRRDSITNNNGTIVGNIYLGSGSHVFNNLEGGTVGTTLTPTNLNVDMRRNYNYLANIGGLGALPKQVIYRDDGDEGEEDEGGEEEEGETFSSLASFLEEHPDHNFTFENAGTFNGNVNVYTGTTNTGSAYTVKIIPHITGSGVGSEDDDPSTEVGYIKGRLAIGTGPYPTINATSVNTGLPNEAKVTVSPVTDAIVHSGEWYFVAKEFLGTNANLPEIEENSYLVDWVIKTETVDGLNALVIGSTVADVSTVPGLSKPGAATLGGLLASETDDDDLNALGGAILGLEEAEDIRKAGEQLKPETNYATQQAAIMLNQATGQHIDARLASVGATGSSGSFAQPSGLGMKQSDPNRSSLGGPTASIDPGPSSGGSALWGRGFGVGFNQDEIENVDGYDARLYGILAGYDNWVTPGVRVGVAVGYANTQIDGEGDTRQNTTDIDSYLAELYGSYKGSGWYATGRTGFTWHDYDTRRVLSAPLDDVAKGDHEGQQYNAALELGAPMRVMGGGVLTPVASLTYSNLRQDGYTEASGAGMALAVEDQDNDSLVSGLGLKGLVPIASDAVLEARALWLHEFADDAQDVTASFAAGGATFTAAGPGVGRDSAALGLGLMAVIGSESTFQLNYDANIREDFIAHIGSAELTVRY